MKIIADGRFPQISLAEDEQRQYDSQALTLLHRTLAEFKLISVRVDKTRWALVRKRKQMGVYKNMEANIQKPGVTLMLGAGLIPGTVDDVMNGLYCDETDELRTVKTLLKYKFIDGAVLNVSERRSAEHPYRFAGIKWFAAKVTLGNLVKDRDLLTYEIDWVLFQRMGETRDANDNPIAYHIYQSVDRPEWPANTMKNLKRAHTATCYLYRKHSDDLVECFFWGEFIASGNVAQYVSDFTMAGKWLAVSNSIRCAEARKLSQLMQSAQTKKISSSVHCDLCNVKPTLFSSSYVPCAGCLQMMCKACSRERHVFQMNRRTAKPQTEFFCVLCVHAAASLVPDFKRPPPEDTSSMQRTDSNHNLASSSAATRTKMDVESTTQSCESDRNTLSDSFDLLLDLSMSFIEDDDESDLSEDDRL